MKHNLTLDDLSNDGWIAFSQAFRNAQEESSEKAIRIFSTLKQSKEKSERRMKIASQSEINVSRKNGFIFYTDPPIEIANEDLKDFPWLMMVK